MSSDSHRPPVRVALLGLGRSVFLEHLPIFREHPSLFTVVAACDLLKERRDRLAVDYPGCRMFRRFEDMLDERDLDLVLVATPSADHREHALESLKRGFRTLVESPLTLTYEDAQMLRGSTHGDRNRLVVMNRGLFACDFLLTKQFLGDPRLGDLRHIAIHSEDFIRLDDWQSVKRLGGGASYYAMPDLIIQALKLLPGAPAQMWSELKRVASLGDVEDFAHVRLKTRTSVTAEIVYDGGTLAENRTPAFRLRGDRGTFSVESGASVGTLTVIDPDFKFPRRRSSVKTPDLVDMHERFPVKTFKVALAADTQSGPAAFWRMIYANVRTAAALQLSLDDAIEAVKLAHLMRKSSPFGK